MLVLTPCGGKATAARAQMRDSLVANNVGLHEMLPELRRLRERGGV